MSTEAHDIQKEVKKYFAVLGGLLFLTFLTVFVSKLHLAISLGITIALVIATYKASLVACHFMHLSVEKKLVYAVLILTVIFFATMLMLFYFSHFNLPEGAHYVS